LQERQFVVQYVGGSGFGMPPTNTLESQREFPFHLYNKAAYVVNVALHCQRIAKKKGSTLGRETSEAHMDVPQLQQHSLSLSVALHLMPGAALFTFVLGAAALGVPAVFALLAGIVVVIVPVELGYLLCQGKRTTGQWSIVGLVDYGKRLPARQVTLWAVPLVAWFIVILVLSTRFLDKRIADAVFFWYPNSVREFASFSIEDGTTYATWAVIAFFAVTLVVNGVIGPVVEELYFRGHLLPRINRFGRAAPLLNAILFSIYHFWTPWQNPGRIVALLPWIYVVWRKQSLRLSIAVHVTVNIVFLLLVVPAFL